MTKNKKNRTMCLGLGLDRAFHNRNYNEKCKILSETLLNIFHNFIPHKIKKIDSKTPEWINRSTKLSLKSATINQKIS